MREPEVSRLQGREEQGSREWAEGGGAWGRELSCRGWGGKGFQVERRKVVCNLLWGPIVKPLQLFLPPSLMPSIKHWYFEICAWHSPHIGKLSTNVVVPLFQVLHRALLRIKTHGGEQ